MDNILEYKGYKAKIEYSVEDQCLYGKVLGINDLIIFDAESSTDIESMFHEAVDEYLDYCSEVGKEPDKEYSGSFNIRISPETHKRLSV